MRMEGSARLAKMKRTLNSNGKEGWGRERGRSCKLQGGEDDCELQRQTRFTLCRYKGCALHTLEVFFRICKLKYNKTIFFHVYRSNANEYIQSKKKVNAIDNQQKLQSKPSPQCVLI